jgi:3-isopropylmalate/(R)-2-methylmalate dehydratase small subunit
VILRGRCWKLGDNVSSDHIISGKYKFEAINDMSKMAVHVLEEVIPGFYKKVSRGDIIVGGKNFGKGSSREQAPRLLKLVGVGAVVAKSFAHIFYRNSINVGLPVIVAKTLPDVSENGDVIEVDVVNGVARNLSKGVEEMVVPYPKVILEVVLSGGLVEYIKRHGGLPWRGSTG